MNICTITPLEQLLICRNLLQDSIICSLASLNGKHEEQTQSSIYDSASRLIRWAEEKGVAGNILQAYILYLLSHEKNLASAITEASGGKIGSSLYSIFLHDIKQLWPMLKNDSPQLIKISLLNNYHPTNEKKNTALAQLIAASNKAARPDEIAQALLSYYRHYGYGDIATYAAFRWDKEHHLAGIKHFEALNLNDIIGYERQKKQLIDNTMAFINKKPANNVLLSGARGTGKSSSVKALANEYYGQGLRLIQINKNQLTELPKIMELLRTFSSKYFIIFLDDLSFEASENEYKYLKSAMEGSVEAKPGNVLIYATSNRRHLIKESWHDRDESVDELYRQDSINETISLSDRFGLIIDYSTPNQNEYLAIIDHYLQKAGISLEKEELRILGHRWELTHSGRSGRLAQQFVSQYLGQKI